MLTSSDRGLVRAHCLGPDSHSRFAGCRRGTHRRRLLPVSRKQERRRHDSKQESRAVCMVNVLAANRRAPEISHFSSSTHIFFLLCMASALFCLDSPLGVSSNYLNCLQDHSKLPFFLSSSFGGLLSQHDCRRDRNKVLSPNVKPFLSGGGEGTQHSLYISMVEVYDMV